MIKLLAHLAHLEISSPDVAATAAFLERGFGLRQVERDDDGSVYLRCWGDYHPYSVIVSPGEQPALVNMAWRTSSEEALDEAARRVQAKGVSGTWFDKRQGHGRSFQFTGPYGHTMELYWDVPQHQAPAELRSVFPDRPEKRSSHAAAPRFLDHVTVASADVRGFAAWYSEVLGFRTMAFTELDHADITVFSVLTTNEKSHDLGVVLDSSTLGGRVNHIAFWTDSHQELLVAADVLMENGAHIEYGPSIHGIGEQTFLYFREPGGLRIELNTGGYRNYVPDWQPHTWKPSLGSNSIYRNSAMPMSMTECFPPDPGKPSATEEGVLPGTEEALLQAAIANPYAQHGQG
ncbi:catechol 2,3-dioxygenase [Kineococcus xinjiangensis]|uniref:Catechol 2,3-dioxygenase n=1 Tax=Kineococcus xinjiangensis TaxID=512762 RepID=A0A2S6IWY4_9ACTN|nr:VOC family protein [Kineococcus xinjiangensis]PPK98843.1 catechol 2,3-dioxygenase [Kineococcus xinjiangensis]